MGAAMEWADPRWLSGILLLLAIVLGLRRLGRAAEGERASSGGLRWLWADRRGVRSAPGPGRGRLWGLALLLGTALVLVALARPQWGTEEELQFDQAREVLLALDLSRSMLATDVAPSRLERSKLLIESVLGALPGERVGLLLFAGTSFLQSPLSADHEVLRDLLPAMTPDYLPQGGTDYRAMLRAALDAFSQTGAADRFLVVLSDGGAHGEEWRGAIDGLKKAGVRVIALGVGSEAGALIPDGRGGIVKDARGAAVLTRLESETLRALAEETGGLYSDAVRWVDVAALVEQVVSEGREGEFVEERTLTKIDRYQWVLAPAFLLLLFSYAFELPTQPRARQIRGRGEGGRSGGADRAGSGRGASRDGSSTGSGRAAAALAMSFVLGGVGSLGSTPAAAQGIGMPATPTTPAPAPDEMAAPSPNRIRLQEVVVAAANRARPGAGDYAALAESTVAYGQELLAGGAPPSGGLVDDGLLAVRLGREMEPAAADWDGLEAALAALKVEPEQPPQSGESQEQQGDQEQQGQDGESQSQQDGEQGGDPQEQGEQGQSGESGEQDGEPGEENSGSQDEQESASAGEEGQESDPSESQSSEDGDAENEGGGQSQASDQRRDIDDESAGLGSLDDEEEESGEEGESAAAGEESEEKEESPRERPATPTRMVGGTAGRDGELLEANPELAGAVGRMDQVREQDAPSVLFQRMNEDEGARPEPAGGPDW